MCSKPHLASWVQLSLIASALLWGCSKEVKSGNEVVIYTSADEPYSQPVLSLFKQKTGIEVRAVYDAEASKTVGLVNRLIAEKARPKADVFWNSEVCRTVVLKQQGVLQKYMSPAAADIPSSFKDPEGYWTGFAARARVLLCNSNLVKEFPASIHELSEPKWKGRFAVANPLFGTAGTQIAAWFNVWGGERTRTLLGQWKVNGVMVVNGNAQARDLVASGEIPACLTDTDDAFEVISKGRPVRMIYPDQGDQDEGLFLIPNTVCLMAGAPHPEAGKKLIDFLLSSEVEEMLANGPSAQIPLRASVKRPTHVKGLGELKILKADYEKVAAALPESAAYIEDSFLK